MGLYANPVPLLRYALDCCTYLIYVRIFKASCVSHTDVSQSLSASLLKLNESHSWRLKIAPKSPSLAPNLSLLSLYPLFASVSFLPFSTSAFSMQIAQTGEWAYESSVSSGRERAITQEGGNKRKRWCSTAGEWWTRNMGHGKMMLSELKSDKGKRYGCVPYLLLCKRNLLFQAASASTWSYYFYYLLKEAKSN